MRAVIRVKGLGKGAYEGYMRFYRRSKRVCLRLGVRVKVLHCAKLPRARSEW